VTVAVKTGREARANSSGKNEGIWQEKDYKGEFISWWSSGYILVLL